MLFQFIPIGFTEQVCFFDEGNGKEMLGVVPSIPGFGTPVQCHGAKTQSRIANPDQTRNG